MISVTFALRVRYLLAAALIVCAVRSLPAQQDSAANSVVFHSNVRRVILDVVVTDSDGHPVRGLSREDFTVKEDGRPQHVLSFDAHDFNEVPNPLPNLPALPSNTWVNVPAVPEKGPLYVLLYDMVNMDIDDQATARKQLLRFISDKPPGARFAIYVFSDGLRLIQGFTADQRKLFAAMDPSSPQPHVPRIFLYGDNYGRGQVGPIVSVFTKIADFLEGLPERKNVIWVTGSIPTTILPTENLNSNVEAVSYNDEIKTAINAMARSQVAVYPVDVRGAVVTHIQSRPQMGASGSAMTTTTDSTVLNASYSTESDIAVATGGRAFYSTNDLTGALAQATEAGANYYTLSYSPSNHKYDGRLRNIHVDLARHDLAKRGCRLAYRRSYCADETHSALDRESIPAADPSLQTLSSETSSGESAPDQNAPDENMSGETVDSLTANMRHGAPVVHQLFFGAHIHLAGSPVQATPDQMATLAQQHNYSRPRHGNRTGKSTPSISLQPYSIDYTVSIKQFKSEPQSHGKPHLLLQVAVAVFDADGQMLISKIQQTRPVAAPTPEFAGSSTEDDPVQPAFVRFQQKIDAPENAASIRLALRDISTGRVGAMEISLPLAPEPETHADAAIRGSAGHNPGSK